MIRVMGAGRRVLSPRLSKVLPRLWGNATLSRNVMCGGAARVLGSAFVVRCRRERSAVHLRGRQCAEVPARVLGGASWGGAASMESVSVEASFVSFAR